MIEGWMRRVAAGRKVIVSGRAIGIALAWAWLWGCSPEEQSPAGAAPRQSVAGAAEDDRQRADVILTNGAIYTMNPDQPRAGALAMGDGRILAVGDAATVTARYRGEVVDLGGAMVLPGFHDTHNHLIMGGVEMLQCDLNAARTVESVLEKVRECDRVRPDTDAADDDWLVGGGWDLSLFPDANPHKRLLDEAVGGRPVYLVGADGHSAWVTSEALARAGVTADTEDPDLGVIERDAEGEPTGTLRESAMALVERLVPEVTEEQRLEGGRAALKLANGFGITSVVDASAGPEELAAWRSLEERDELTARVVASIRMPDGSMEGRRHLLEPASRGSGDLVRADAAKIFLDGVLEGETAALLEPYLDPQGKGANRRGALNVPWERLLALVTDLDARGIQVHMHAIGDRAVRQGLDAVEAARQANGPSDNRHHITHLQLVHADDHPRFAELEVLANFQALWAYPDAYITDVNLPAVGQARVDRMYPIKSIMEAGGTIVGSSDWSVSSMNPLDAIEVAVTRRDPSGEIEAVLNSSEAVELSAMLAAYTRNAAYLMHQEDLTGTLEPGKRADLVVLEADLFALEPSAINETRVVATYFNGRRVYSDEE